MNTSPRRIAASTRHTKPPVRTCKTSCNGSAATWWPAASIIAVAVVSLALFASPGSFAQEEDAAKPPEAQPKPDPALQEPVLEADALIKGRSVTSWRDGRRRWLLIEGDVSFKVGAFGFQGRNAVVRIDPVRKPGKTEHHIVLYLDEAQTLRGPSRVEAESPRLLVTVATSGKLSLETDLLDRAGQAPPTLLVRDAQDRIVRYEQNLARGTEAADIPPDLFDAEREARRQAEERAAGREGLKPVQPGERPQQPDDEEPLDEGPPEIPFAQRPPPGVSDEGPIIQPSDPIAEADPSILPTRGAVSFLYEQFSTEPLDENTRTASLLGNVNIIYQDFDSGRSVSLTAENVVVFIDVSDSDGRLLDMTGLKQEQIIGIYLEDNVVITQGSYTIRAPRVYVDPRKNKAVLLDTVLYTVDVQQQIPLYVRARQIRQESRNNFEARNAVLTTSDFAEPHFAIGSDKLNVTHVEGVDGNSKLAFKSGGTTLRAGDVPFFWWPVLAGETSRKPPLQDISVRYESDDDGDANVDVRTKWDLFSLAGREAPEGVELSGDLDWRGEHGVAFGSNLKYEFATMYGEAQGYFLPDDDGEDDIASRNDVQFDSAQRGFLQWQHRQYLLYDIELSLQLAYVSDETFLEEFFREEAFDTQPYETSIYLKHQKNERAFTVLANYNVNDFLAQTTLLQSPGYFVNRAPELTYRRIGTSLFDNRLTYFTENSISRVQIDPGDDRPSDRGFGRRASAELFGITPTTRFRNRSALAMIPRDWRNRFDSRHEINAPMRFWGMDIVPYAAGRFTAFDEDFESFSGEDDQVRFWGTAGTRVHTQFHRTDSAADSRMFDVHQLRHIVEPSANIFISGSTLEDEDWPIYDDEIEGIGEGFGTRLGVRNTWETQRGGPGRWRTVEWLVVNTDYIYRSDDADVDAELARFFDYRPEYSRGGNHLNGDFRWAMTEALALVGDMTYSLEQDNVPVYRLGAVMRHSPQLNTFVDYTEIDAVSSQLLTYGARYEMTPKWTGTFRHRLSFSDNETRDITLTLERKLPQIILTIVVRYDEIDNEQSVGFSVTPEGFGGNFSPVDVPEY